MSNLGFDKGQRVRHLLSVVASIVGMLAIGGPVGWYMARPVLVSSVATAMAGDIEETIDKKLAPIAGGFTAIVQQNINRLRRDISRLEFIQMNEPANWTIQMADDLTDMRIELDGQEAALNAMRRTDD